VSLTEITDKKNHSFFLYHLYDRTLSFVVAEADSCLLSSSKISQRIICITVVARNIGLQIKRTLNPAKPYLLLLLPADLPLMASKAARQLLDSEYPGAATQSAGGCFA